VRKRNNFDACSFIGNYFSKSMCHLGQYNEEDSVVGYPLLVTVVEGHVEFGLLLISVL
jgi:hypothetical protein